MPCPNCRCPSCLALMGLTIPSAESLPPPSELMTANRAPTHSEVAYSRDIISSPENMVSLIETMVDDLGKRKAELLGLISKHKTAISPLRSFPPELWAEIFAQFVAMADRNWYMKHSPPLMLMRICSRWRRIILDTPRLWTRILTPHPMINSWITRSKELPLQLELNLSPPTSYPALEALIPHSHRWQDVDFLLEPGSHSMLARVRNRLPSLKRLNLLFGDIAGIVDFCEVAPQLVEVGLKGIEWPITIRLPWDQLRTCTADNGEVAHYVLQHAENLQRLCLDMSDVSMAGSPGLELPKGPQSLHPKLHTLIVKWNFEDQGNNSFFSSITLPSLQTLDIHFDYLDVDDDEQLARINTYRAGLARRLARILVAFFERSCTRLSTLKLTKIPFSQDALIDCLAFSPSLISLDIEFDNSWYTINEELLNKLNLNHPRHVLPRLRSLAFRGATEIYIEEPMANLIASRRHINPRHDGVAMLENLTLESTFPRSIDDSGPARFHRFVTEGLNIIYGKDWHL